MSAGCVFVAVISRRGKKTPDTLVILSKGGRAKTELLFMEDAQGELKRDAFL